MARLPRFYGSCCSQHVIQRGNNREACFYEEQDYKVYLDVLKQSAQKYKVYIHAFVLMTNHVHLLVTAADEKGVPRMMQALGRKYVQYFNYTHNRTGTLWEGRYKSTLVDSEHYLLLVYRYIELNPVRANMVEHPAEYPWSSYRFNGVGLSVECIHPHEKYLDLGCSAKVRQENYRSLFLGHIEERELHIIRESANKGWVLGSDRFKSQIENKTGRRVTPVERGGDRKSKKYKES